jgi:hypothetical protein
MLQIFFWPLYFLSFVLFLRDCALAPIAPENAHDLALVTISKTGNGWLETVTVGEAWTIDGWELDGWSMAGRGMVQSLTCNAGDYNAGTYILGVRVCKDGAHWSTAIRIPVTN